MKKLFLLSLAVTICSLSLSAQHDKKDSLIVIDGKISNTELDSIDAKTIDIVIPDTLKNQISESLIYVNGYVYNSGINSIDLGEIESLTILKGETAKAIYGKAGNNGVILVTLHKASNGAKHPDLKHLVK